MPGADPTIHYRLDIPRAKALLAEAGYAGGLHKSILPSGPEFLPMVESLQATAKQAGVDIEIIPGRHVEEFRDRKFQLYFGNSGARLPDPFATATQFAYNPDNRDEARLGGYYMWRTAWNAPDFTEMVNRSRLLTDAAKRAELFADLDRRYRESSPSLIMFFQRTDAYAVRKTVQNYVGHPTWTTRWDKVAKN
jgi:peptide/nickel transport system substrate-binding protein